MAEKPAAEPRTSNASERMLLIQAFASSEGHEASLEPCERALRAREQRVERAKRSECAIPRSKKILGYKETVMGLTADDFAESVDRDSGVDGRPLSDALAEVAVDIDTDSDKAVRDPGEDP